MNKHYLDLDFSTATFYEYSKTEKEGFESHTDSNDRVSFRKFYNKGVYGLLQSISIRDTNYGKKLSVRLLDGDNLFLMTFPLYSANGQIDNRFAEPLICTFPNMSLEQAYRLFPYRIEKTFEGNTKPNTFYGVSVKLADLDKHEVSDAVLPKYKKAKKDEVVTDAHIPKVEFKEQLGSWKPTPASIGIKDEFLIKVLEGALEKLGYKDNNSQNTASQPTQATPPQSTGDMPETASIAPLEDDDLPF